MCFNDHAGECLGPHDVLCGRDRDAFNHVGNRRFRVLVSLTIDRYIRAETRQEKSLVIASLTESVRKTGGRFVKRTRAGLLVELNEKQTQQKVGHAIRDSAISKQLVKPQRKAGIRSVSASLSGSERSWSSDDTSASYQYGVHTSWGDELSSSSSSSNNNNTSDLRAMFYEQQQVGLKAEEEEEEEISLEALFQQHDEEHRQRQQRRNLSICFSEEEKADAEMDLMALERLSASTVFEELEESASTLDVAALEAALTEMNHEELY